MTAGMKHRNIFLIGMMGSGKTSTGRELARLLDYSFVDMDGLIEKEAGTTISVLFQSRGEEYFRGLESRKLQAVCNKEHQVVSTGGGIILSAGNRDAIMAAGTAIYLKTSLDWLVRRLRGSKDRPLLAGEGLETKLASLAAEREKLYQSAAILEILTDAKTPGETAAEIVKMLKA